MPSRLSSQKIIHPPSPWPFHLLPLITPDPGFPDKVLSIAMQPFGALAFPLLSSAPERL